MRLKAPLLSLAASGNLTAAVAFRDTHAGAIAQRITVPRDPRSPAQLSSRTKFTRAAEFWRRAPWDDYCLNAWTTARIENGVRIPTFQWFVSSTCTLPEPTTLPLATAISAASTTAARMYLKKLQDISPCDPGGKALLYRSTDGRTWSLGKQSNIQAGYAAFLLMSPLPFPAWFKVIHQSGWILMHPALITGPIP